MNIRTGYYTVGSTVYKEKLPAVLYATETKLPLKWHFNVDAYNQVDWTVEPVASIDEHYRIRAQNIREEYDYVVVMCSGGADSTNVAYSFLRNGIHLDEIIASAPLGGLRDWRTTSNDPSASNTMSETFLAQLPLMEEIRREFPAVKITINDYWDTLLSYNEDDWIMRCGEWVHPTSGARYDIEKFKHLRDLAESGKRIGIVYGIDKPYLYYKKDGTVWVMINDLACNVQRPAFRDAYSNVDNVLFYWSHDYPQLIIKQAHVVAKWLGRPENSIIDGYTRSEFQNYLSPVRALHNSVYQRAIVPVLYPTTHRSIFQGHKPTRNFFGEHDDWFYKHHYGTRTYQMLDSDFRNFFKAIDTSLLNETKDGIKLFIQSYCIGSKNSFRTIQ